MFAAKLVAPRQEEAKRFFQGASSLAPALWFGLSFKLKFSYAASLHTAAFMPAGAAMRHISILAVNTHSFGAVAGPASAPLYNDENPSGVPGEWDHWSPTSRVLSPAWHFLNAAPHWAPALLLNPSTAQPQSPDPTPPSSHEELQNQTHPRLLSPCRGAGHRQARTWLSRTRLSWTLAPVGSVTVLSQTPLATSTTGSWLLVGAERDARCLLDSGMSQNRGRCHLISLRDINR